ncbi:WD40-repeat-containing domain protein [Triangularia setosa]|uniref:WD40-repeat-containing domain protein n=1 Tax=Triangularia setosa TaxID=2587417 RepID=A0AAN7A381_9PEZI|nr:WD40-repeat-containing domain protein [Podospora setosa]
MTDQTPSSRAEVPEPMAHNDHLLSSPPRPPPSSLGKERRKPSITPRKFQRFFTPRSRVSSKPSAARKALHDLTAPALNRGQTPLSSPLKPISEEQLGAVVEDDLPDLRTAKRRKTQHTPSRSHLPSPLQTSPALLPTPDIGPGLSSPIRHVRFRPNRRMDVDQHDGVSEDEEEEDPPLPSPKPKKIVPLHTRGLGGQLVHRMTGDVNLGRLVPGRHLLAITQSEMILLTFVIDWRTDTAKFYSKPDDVHLSSSHEGAPRAIPFCTTSCHTVGDEEGYVRLLDTSKDFSKIHLSFQAHGNAVIDLAFSGDDKLLATASGDQTGRVIDTETQTPLNILGHHTASLKQIRFQPGRGQDCVLATSGRDGSIQIWDLRCKGGPVQDMSISNEDRLRHGAPKPVNPGCVVNSIYDAHARTQRQTKSSKNSSTTDVARTGEVPGRIGEVSVTSLQFLPPGREHLLLSACEADASIKLWDIRAVHTHRHHKTSTPISFTAPPPSHAAWRPFGIASMTLNTAGSRLYALCKDNTVYTYSTSHLVLGSAAELTPALPGQDPPRRRHYPHNQAHEGLGPLYGFRHPLFHATSFYVKAALRPASNGNSEMLAVGSSDGCAVLFPTDERYLFFSTPDSPEESYFIGGSTALLPTATPSRPGLRSGGTPSLLRTNSNSLFGRQQHDTRVPITKRGVPLIRGHDKEVGALTWTGDGRKLVTVGDDYLVRCWRDGDDEVAKDLRRGGEGEGRRWGCGWGDLGDGWEGDGGEEVDW